MLLIKLLFCLTILAVAASFTEKDVKDKFKGFKLQGWQLSIFKATLRLLFRANNTESVTILNKQVDFLLTSVDNFAGITGFNSIDLPRFNASFKWTVLSGGIVLKDGFLYGVSTLERHGDVTVIQTESDLKITIPLGFSNLTFTYEYDLDFMKVGRTGKATGGSQGNKFSVGLHFDIKTLKVKLDEFNFNDLGLISFRLHRNGLTALVINLITPVVMPLLKPILKDIVKGFIVNEFESIFEMYNNAVCPKQPDC
ncbi:hypothetical protein ILUMI_12148 [Ignelater luminosus]|uniref:Uncharacterized protein n=1 Tax=Ignelater luminosus TaxID=2038154 RepID=A0A8K0CZ14_IGNLU|nr:hypothetical protein ILUMI_12148 [Ignelater luminosus]